MVGVGGKSSDPDGDTEPTGAPNGDPNPEGRGEYDPDTQLSEWYEPKDEAAEGFSLIALWAYRDLIEADLHSQYGVAADMAAPCLAPPLAGHSWRWLLVRIRGLLETPDTRLWMALAPDPTPNPAPAAKPTAGDYDQP